MLIFACIAATVIAGIEISAFLHQGDRLRGGLSYLFAFALLLSLIGYAYYLSLVASIPYPLLIVGLVGIAGIPLVLQSIRHQAYSLSLPTFGRPGHVLILLIGLLAAMLPFNERLYRWGGWDAWAIWNLHAKYLSYPEYWSNLFTNKLFRTHPDYPLMLPSLVAYMWRSVETATPLAPMILAHLIYFAILITVFLGLTRFNYLFPAIVALCVFALDTKFIEIASSQYADTLLAFFILISFVMYKEAQLGIDRRLFFLLGFIVGSATWIKNEGALFFLSFSFAVLCFHFRNFRSILHYAAGTLIPFLILIHFKQAYAPANDLIHAGRDSSLIAMILNPGRYRLIITYFFTTAFTYYWALLVLLTFMLVKKIAFVKSLPSMVLGLVFSGYFMVYLTTPNDLEWHLNQSIDRLFHHIYPACLYLLLLKLSTHSHRLKTFIV
ncbi:hypothetical protein [Siphonobacter sp.]|uniref:hypothetical protein n=1 Tax=Siphonobacter sp. TaxID=1869184 RepID=UPI003B3A8A30